MSQAFSNFPMNMIADFYGGAQLLSTMYTVATLVGIVIQLVLSTFIGKVKNIKALTLLNRIIKNPLYIGILCNGESKSAEVLTDLQIVDVELFERAQNAIVTAVP